MITRRFAWIDIETTGLVPEKGYILEVACIITDHQLNELDEFETVIQLPLLVKLFPHRYMDDFVFKMHTDNRLLEECTDSTMSVTLNTAQKEFYEFLEPYHNTFNDELYLTGNSIGSLDIPFLRKHMPRVMDLVHYRSLDISGLRLGLEQIFNDVGGFWLRNQPGSIHRALDDVKSSIKQLKSYEYKIFNKYTKPITFK